MTHKFMLPGRFRLVRNFLTHTEAPHQKLFASHLKVSRSIDSTDTTVMRSIGRKYPEGILDLLAFSSMCGGRTSSHPKGSIRIGLD